MNLDPNPTLEPLANLHDVATLLWHTDLADLQTWDGGFFHELAAFSTRYDVPSCPESLAGLLDRFDSEQDRARRARVLRRDNRRSTR